MKNLDVPHPQQSHADGQQDGVLYIPGLAAILLAIGMGLLGMGYIAQKNKARKVGGVLLLAFALLQLIVGLMEIRSAAM